MRRLILMILMTFPLSTLAVDEAPPKLENLPDVPEPPEQVQNGENMEPEITILRSGKKIIQEYRRGGRIYMVKIVPDIGPAYYFLDTNGDGLFDARNSDPDRGSHVNMWKILEWD
ncbi:DUF2782 domain-containing protein [Methylovulum miyakonense]|uniref:DUF2782 domain-containing protein n=2 Tax=Methylovulum miyakonense TaxID=645578 RepID=UPI00048DEE93